MSNKVFQSDEEMQIFQSSWRIIAFIIRNVCSDTKYARGSVVHFATDRIC